jgi:hypothetical protein
MSYILVVNPETVLMRDTTTLRCMKIRAHDNGRELIVRENTTWPWSSTEKDRYATPLQPVVQINIWLPLGRNGNYSVKGATNSSDCTGVYLRICCSLSPSEKAPHLLGARQLQCKQIWGELTASLPLNVTCLMRQLWRKLRYVRVMKWTKQYNLVLFTGVI